MSTTAEPVWDKLPAETGKAYAAFCVFRDMEVANRSVRGAWIESSDSPSVGHAQEPGGRTVKCPPLWYEWAQEHRWTERADAYEVYRDRLRRRAVEKGEIAEQKRRLREMYDKQYTVGNQLVDAGKAQIGVAIKGLASIDASILKPSEIAQLSRAGAANVQTGADLIALALGTAEILSAMGDVQEEDAEAA